MENFVNPKVKDFLKQHSEMTLLGLSWAIYWRMGIVIFTIHLGCSLKESLFVVTLTAI
jgi:hypothetical protein